MSLQDEFNKEMDRHPGIVWGMPDYIVWLENKLLEARKENKRS